MYSKERDFLLYHIKYAFDTLARSGPNTVRQKSAHDLVTEVDINMERYLSGAIREHFPADIIQGEELSNTQVISGRTWTIDPIDGTCNMARHIPLYGVQCALFDGGEPVVSAIYLPFQDELFYAVRGQGCFCNGKPVHVNKQTDAANAIVSFGDYSRKNPSMATAQHRAIGRLYPQIGKIRMFGAACLDFSRLAAGQLDGTVVITKNVWDLAPGVLLCQEAGGIVTNLVGDPYHFNDDGVIISATPQIKQLLTQCFQNHVYIRKPSGEKLPVKGCLFDFDGVVVDTETYHYRSWNYGAKDLGTQLTWEEYLPLKSTGTTPICKYIMDKAGVQLSQEEMLQIGVRKAENFRDLICSLSEKDILPGVQVFLQWLKDRGIVTAMASSSNTSIPIAKDFGLDKYFDAMFDGSTKMPRKPAPDVFLTAAKAIGAEPAQCIVFEDSLAGIEAACNAGMAVIAVGGIRSTKAVAHIHDFSEIGTLFCYE